MDMDDEGKAKKCRVFISYSRQQAEWKDRLLPHLILLEKYIDIEVWHDGKISPGDNWRELLENEIARADIAIFLISSDFLASSFIRDVEITQFLKRREHEGLRIVPILIRPCAWRAVPWLSSLQMFPRDGKSVANDYQSFYDTPYTEVAEYILSYIERLPPKPY